MESQAGDAAQSSFRLNQLQREADANRSIYEIVPDPLQTGDGAGKLGDAGRAAHLPRRGSRRSRIYPEQAAVPADRHSLADWQSVVLSPFSGKASTGGSARRQRSRR